MGLEEIYFQQAIDNLFSTIEKEKVLTQLQKQEDIKKSQANDKLSLNSSNTKNSKPDDKYSKLLGKLGSTIFFKLLEHGFNPFDITDARSAIKKLLNAGMPVEHVILDLQEHGKDIGSVETMLSKHGLGAHAGEALQKILQSRSVASGITYAEGLIDAEESKQGLDFEQVA